MFRKKYLIKPKIQFKYMFISVITVIITGVAVYFALWHSFVYSSSLEQLSAGDVLSLERAFTISFLWIILILCTAFVVHNILLFHQFIGPIYVFERLFRHLEEGDFTSAVYLRKKDELKGMAVDIQAMINNISSAVNEDRGKIEDITKLIEQGNKEEAKKKLSEVTQWFKI